MEKEQHGKRSGFKLATQLLLLINLPIIAVAVIAHAPADAARKWAGDLVAFLAQNQIGCALWNYKYLDFGLVDLEGNPCSCFMEK